MVERFFFLKIILLIFALIMSACSDRDGASDTATSAEDTGHYIETGDLDAIQSRGSLRIIVPRFDGNDALPRQGFTVQNYRDLAQAFVEELGLNVEWIYVEKFADLIPALNSGRGDLIVTNFTATAQRKIEVDFTKAISQVDEVLIVRKMPDTDGKPNLNIILPESTAYIETLEEYKGDKPFVYDVRSIGTIELLQGISTGIYDATVLDSDIAEQLLPDFPLLARSEVLSSHRPIAWALRKQSPKLLQRVNEFFVSHHIRESFSKSEALNWDEIKRRGRLRVLTLNNPASYFMYRGELMGFDYDLVARFAKLEQLHLSIITKNSIHELFDALKMGEGDVIAASITRSPERESQGLSFTRSYLQVTEQLVGREHGARVSTIEELANFQIGVNPDTVFYQRLQQYVAEGVDLNIVIYPDASTEELISLMLQGEFDFTIADSHLVALEQAHHQDIRVNLELKNSAIAWVVRPEQVKLNQELSDFIKSEHKSLFYNVTYNKYFKSPRNARLLQEGRVSNNSNLSPYDKIVKTEAKKYQMDWRLVIAQMYQESKFDPRAKSFAGAIGLMQVMPRTAREMGFENLDKPENGIGAGVSYMNWVENRFPDSLDFESRIYFTLAAYNAGAGHVRDARRLARQLGKNPNKWFGNVENSMALLSKPKYYKQARFGYVRGSEPVAYVQSIRERYLGYLNAGF